jgi:hypothetical protein
MFLRSQAFKGYKYSTIDYINFIQGGKTSHGVSFEEIMIYTDRQLEYDHQFIQWIFPLDTPSMFNADAPIINLQELSNFPAAKSAIVRSSDKLTTFWGINTDAVNRERIRLLDGHNGLRFSRYLQSMVYHKEDEIAEKVLRRVLNNLDILSPSLGKSGKTLWEELFLEAREKMRKLE